MNYILRVRGSPSFIYEKIVDHFRVPLRKRLFTDILSGYKKYLTDILSGYKQYLTDILSGYKKHLTDILS